ncbi:glycosyltransferase family 4 protein [Roseomonas sp. SSH11]|uniref:Glycosyltransferase family 4 protein n=1 Tax=Pararoseomonas baculiformis TaxID=2820812 RepID=A0ABS4ADN3_9PROT|nr:glycosyltransferase family 4 protein [Pararoseomonas baculiformis]MBP0445127.1 glycosyltransferase family 4 protein [Pararoseomonas baculiformis]
MSDPSVPLVLSVFPSFAVGGAQVRFAALANFQGRRWRHVVVSLDGRYECAERISPEVPLQRHPFQAPHGERLPSRLRRIRETLRVLRPDALVTSNWGSIEWAIANLTGPRIRHLHTEDGFGPDEVHGQKPRRVLTRALALRWSEVALPSSGLLQTARATWRLPESRLHFIANGLDLTRFRTDGPRADLAVPGDGPMIGTVAALRPEKNLARLLRAAAILRDEGVPMRLLIAGRGTEEQALRDLTRTLGLADRVLFAGHVPDPSSLYRAMDLFALSSDTEQMPFSVLEAMASGLPVAATDVGDVRFMLSDINRPLAVERTDVALAGALRTLLNDPALRARIGTANREKAEQDYDQGAMFRAYAKLITG